MSHIDDDDYDDYYNGNRYAVDHYEPRNSTHYYGGGGGGGGTGGGGSYMKTPVASPSRHPLQFSSSPFFTPSAVDSATTATVVIAPKTLASIQDVQNAVSPTTVPMVDLQQSPQPLLQPVDAPPVAKTTIANRIKQIRRPLPSNTLANTEQSREMIFNCLIQSRKILKVTLENKTGHTVGNFITDPYGATQRTVIQVDPGKPIEYMLSSTELLAKEQASRLSIRAPPPGSYFFARISIYVYFRDANGSVYSRPFTYIIFITEDQLAQALVKGATMDYTQSPLLEVVGAIIPEQTLDPTAVAESVEKQRTILRGEMRDSSLGPMVVVLDPTAATTNYEKTLADIEPRGKQESVFGVHSGTSLRQNLYNYQQQPPRTPVSSPSWADKV